MTAHIAHTIIIPADTEADAQRLAIDYVEQINNDTTYAFVDQMVGPTYRYTQDAYETAYYVAVVGIDDDEPSFSRRYRAKNELHYLAHTFGYDVKSNEIIA